MSVLNDRCTDEPGDGGFDCGQCPFDNVCDLTLELGTFPPRLTREEIAMDDVTFRRTNRSLTYGPGEQRSEFE